MQLWLPFKMFLKFHVAISVVVAALLKAFGFIQFQQGSAALRAGFVFLFILSFIVWLSLYDIEDIEFEEVENVFSLLIAMLLFIVLPAWYLVAGL